MVDDYDNDSGGHGIMVSIFDEDHEWGDEASMVIRDSPYSLVRPL